MRQYIRHPSDIPIEYQLDDGIEYKNETLNNISAGGLCFQSNEAIEEGSGIIIRFPLIDPTIKVKGVVVWCNEVARHHGVGVMFIDSQTAFRARMLEQLCHIEHYRKSILETDGRKLSGEEAAREWIAKYAEKFPIYIE